MPLAADLPWKASNGGISESDVGPYR